MCELPDVARIIADIYDAALQPMLWENVLARVATLVQGHVSGILVKDPIRKCVEAHCHAGGDPHYMKLYAETYSQLGPVATSRFSDADQVVSIPELVDYQEFCRGRFYQEWARPQGWVDVGVAVLERSSAGYAYLSVSRHRAHGMVDDEMRARIRLIVPHVRRAVLIGRRAGDIALGADQLVGAARRGGGKPKRAGPTRRHAGEESLGSRFD